MAAASLHPGGVIIHPCGKSINFTPAENLCLLEEYYAVRSILLDRFNVSGLNGNTRRRKAWESITAKVNRINPAVTRTVLCVQKRFKNMVQEAKKELAKRQTGGGTTPQKIKKTTQIIILIYGSDSPLLWGTDSGVSRAPWPRTRTPSPAPAAVLTSASTTSPSRLLHLDPRPHLDPQPLSTQTQTQIEYQEIHDIDPDPEVSCRSEMFPGSPPCVAFCNGVPQDLQSTQRFPYHTPTAPDLDINSSAFDIKSEGNDSDVYPTPEPPLTPEAPRQAQKRTPEVSLPKVTLSMVTERQYRNLEVEHEKHKLEIEKLHIEKEKMKMEMEKLHLEKEKLKVEIETLHLEKMRMKLDIERKRWTGYEGSGEEDIVPIRLP